MDLGCGIGRHTVLFAGNGFNTCGFDISKYGLDKTKEWLDSLNLSANLKEGDMLELPYEMIVLIVFYVEMLFHTRILWE